MNGRSLEFGIRITADGRVAVVESGNVRSALKGVGDEARVASGNADRLRDSIGRVVSAGAGLVGIGLGAGLLRDTARVADSMTNLESRVRLVTASLTEQATASDAIYAISQRTRQAFDATGDLYFKVAKGADTLGLSQQRIIGLTETISQSVALSGAGAESAKASIMQFGQALASGTLRGDELNSVMEQTPALAEAIAKGMGKTTGELRAMGEQGAITVQEIVAALEKQAPEIARQFAELTPTISGAWQNVESAALRYVGQADKASGASAVLASSLAVVAEQFDGVVATASMVTAVGLGGYLGKAAAARIETLALASAARAAAVQYDALGMAIATTTTKASAAGAVVGALGGPIGLVTTALTVGVTAWALWGGSAEAAGKKAFDAVKALAELERRNKYGDGDVAAARERLDKLNAELPGIFEPRALDATIKEIVALERYLAKVEAMETKTVASISESWGGLHRTKAQQRANEIAELDKIYVAEAAKIKGNADLQLRLASEYQVKLQVINDKYKDKKHGADKAVIDASVEANKDYAKSISDLIGIEAKATGAAQELTAAEQVRERLIASGAWDRLAPETRNVVDAYVASANAAIRSVEAEKALHAAQQARLQEQYRALDANDAEIKQLEQHNAEIGLTAEAVDALRLVRLDDAIAIKERQYAQAAATSTDASYIETLKEEVEQLKQIRDLRAAGSVKEASARLGKEMAQEFARGYDNLERGLTDTIIRGGENGLDNLADMYARTLKAMAVQQFFFRPIVQPVYSTVASMFGVDMRQAGGSWANTGNLMSAGNSAYNMFTGGFTAPGSMYSNFALSGVGQSLGLSTAGSNMGGVMGAWAGDTAMVSELSALGSTIGTAIPYIAAATAVLSMIDWGGGTPHKGGLAFGRTDSYASPDTGDAIRDYLYATGSKAQTALPLSYTNFQESDWTKREDDSITAALGSSAMNLAKSINAITRAYGAGSGYEVGLAYSADGDDGSRGRFGVIKDGKIISGNRARYDDDPQQGLQQFSAEFPMLMLKAIRDIDLGSTINAWLDSSISGTTDALKSLSQEQAAALVGALESGWLDEYLAQVGNVGKSFQDMTDDIVEFAAVANLKPVFDELGLDIYKVGLDLADRFGGADALASGLSAYYDATRTESEKLAYSVAQVRGEFARWNVATPATVADLRSMEDVVVALGDEGADAYAALVKIAPAFAQIATAANASVDAMLGRLDTLTEASWLAQVNSAFGSNLTKLPTKAEMQAYLEALQADPVGNAELIAKTATLFDGWSSLMDDTTASYKELAAASRAAGDDIADLVRDLTVGKGGLATPEELLGNTRSAYYASLDQVRQQAAAGNYDNVDRLVDDARAYVEAQKGYSASSDITQTVIARIVNELRGLGIQQFATGAAFTNGIVTRPTYFNIGEMGEAGKEGIFPLADVGGSLGIRGIVPDNSGELAALRSEVVALRTTLERLLSGQIAAVVESSQRSAQTIVDGQIAAAKTQSWAARSAPALT